MGVGKIEVDGRGGEPVMPKNFLDRSQRDILLKGQCRKRVPEHMRGHILGDVGAVGDTLHNFLHLPWANKPARPGL